MFVRFLLDRRKENIFIIGILTYDHLTLTEHSSAICVRLETEWRAQTCQGPVFTRVEVSESDTLEARMKQR